MLKEVEPIGHDARPIGSASLPVKRRLGLLRRFRPESRYFIAIGFIIGLLAIAVVPPISTFDGPGHYFRALQIASRHFRATRYSERQLGGELPERNSRFVHTLWGTYWPNRHFLSFSEWSAIARRRPGDNNRVREEFTNIAVYSPANYVPQSLAMALSRIVTRSPLWGYRAACMLNLACYVALIVLALETMPHFQTSLLLIASSPLLLIEAATVNVDGLNFAVPLCIFAIVWKMRSAPGGDHSGLGVAAATFFAWWTALLKPTDVVCLGFLCFIPVACFGSRRKKAAWLVATMGVAAALWLLWNRPYLDVNIAGWFVPNHPPISAQKAWLLQHPGDFFRAFGVFMRRDFLAQWKDFYGNVGGWSPEWAQPVAFRLSYVFLIILAVESARNSRRDWPWALITLANAAALLVLIAVALWVSYGVKDTNYIPYYGGRYLFLVFTFGFVAWSKLVKWPSRLAGNYLLAAGLFVNGFSLALILIPTAFRVAG